MEEILPEALTEATNPTVFTVVYRLFRVVVPKLADRTIVMSCGDLTLSAKLANRLWRVTSIQSMCSVSRRGKVWFSTSS